MTIVGWKEDFNMSFSELVPAQTDAVEYLEKVAQKHKNKLRSILEESITSTIISGFSPLK